MIEQIIKITSWYSGLSGFFGVRTGYDLEELNQVCAYLQLVRYDLPCFSIVDDGLCEDDVVNLLDQIYDCEKIVSDEPLSCDGEIDLYENWETYAVGANRKTLNLRAAMPGVQLAVVELMLIQAKEDVTSEEGEKIIAQLEYIKSGESVPRDWQLETLGKDIIYTGKINLDPKKRDLLLLSDEKIKVSDSIG